MVPDAGLTCPLLRSRTTICDTDDRLIQLALDELVQLISHRDAFVSGGGTHAQGLSHLRRRIAHTSTPFASARPHPNLHTMGAIMHKVQNQDHSMYTAILTAENMLGTAPHGVPHDVWAVNTDFEYLEEQRIDAPSVAARAP